VTGTAQRRLTVLLAGTALALAWLLFEPSAISPGGGQVPLAEPGPEAPAGSDPLADGLGAPGALPALERLRQTVERPLFLASRRAPRAAVASAPVPAIDDRRYALVGVVLFEGRRSALIEVPGEPRASQVDEGERLDGWRVERIETGRVLLARGDRRRIIRLSDRERRAPVVSRRVPAAPEPEPAPNGD